MKKFCSVILAVLLALAVVPFSAISAAAPKDLPYITSEDYVYYSHTTDGGNDQNKGLKADAPKGSWGAATGAGAIGVVKNGGTFVVTGKGYVGANYTLPELKSPLLITSNYAGEDFREGNSSCYLKMKAGATFTIKSDLILDDVVIYQETAEQNSFIVTKGATMVVGEGVTNKSAKGPQMKIVVEKGGRLIVNGGKFEIDNQGGEVIENYKYEYNTVAPKPTTGTGDGTTTGTTTGTTAGTENLPYVTSSDYAYLVHSNDGGSDQNAGLSAASPKASWGTLKASGAVGLVKNGGTIVISGKGYVNASYTLPELKTPLLITSNYAGTDHREGNTNCYLKMKGGATYTIQSDVILDDIVIYQESSDQNSFIVKSGATMVVGKGVTNKSAKGIQMKIVVEAGGRLIVGGGNFEIENQGGEVIENYTYDYMKAKVNTGTTTDTPVTDKEPGVAFVAFNTGVDTRDGLTEATAKKTLGTINNSGALGNLAGGGTLVVAGRLYLSADVTIPKLGSLLTITGNYNGKNYVNADDANNPAGAAIKMKGGCTLTIATDAYIDNVIFFQESSTPTTLRIANGATVTLGKNVICMTKQLFNMNIVVDSGATLILEDANHGFESIDDNGGTVIMPMDKTEIKMTINSKTAYVNGVAKTLDAAPIIKNSRTLLPVRFLAENLGADVSWNDATKTATLKTSDVTIDITINAKSMKVNGDDVALDSPAIIENSRTYLPLRAIANALGVSNDNITWDDSTKTATFVK